MKLQFTSKWVVQLAHDPIRGKAVQKLGHRRQGVQKNCAWVSWHITLQCKRQTEKSMVTAWLYNCSLTSMQQKQFIFDLKKVIHSRLLQLHQLKQPSLRFWPHYLGQMQKGGPYLEVGEELLWLAVMLSLHNDIRQLMYNNVEGSLGYEWLSEVNLTEEEDFHGETIVPQYFSFCLSLYVRKWHIILKVLYLEFLHRCARKQWHTHFIRDLNLIRTQNVLK